MLQLQWVDAFSPLVGEVRALYHQAFPANELIEFNLLLPGGGRDGAELAAWTYNGEFCGFISLLTLGDITHILYFAMKEDLRGQGLGGLALEQINALLPDKRIIADLERPKEGAPADDLRCRRERFYQRHGYADSGVGYAWRGDDYRIFIYNGSITGEEFGHFWKHYMK